MRSFTAVMPHAEATVATILAHTVLSPLICSELTHTVTSGGSSMRSIGLTIIAMAMMVAVASAQTAPNPVTFTKNVAPILEEKCQACHRPNTFAPMSLVTYEETRPWAKSIKAKV